MRELCREEQEGIIDDYLDLEEDREKNLKNIGQIVTCSKCMGFNFDAHDDDLTGQLVLYCTTCGHIQKTKLRSKDWDVL